MNNKSSSLEISSWESMIRLIFLLKHLEFFVYMLCVLIVYPFIIQMIMLEAAKATTETVDALRTGAAAMKAMQKATLVLILSPF